MAWQALILIQAFLTALAVIVTRLLARDKYTAKASLAITAGWFVCLYGVGLLILPHFGNVQLSSLYEYWWRFLLGGLAFALTNAFTYYSLVYLDASVGTIFNTINALFTVFGASILLHENLDSQQLVGAVILLTAIIYTALATRHRPTKVVHRRLIIGLAYAIAAGVFYAIASINEKSLLAHVSVGDFLLFGWFGETVMAVLVVLLLQPGSLKVFKVPRVVGWTAVLGALRAVSGLCFILAIIRSNNVGLMTVISNFRLIIVVLLGVWLLKERQKTYQKLFGSAVAIIALSLMFWQK